VHHASKAALNMVGKLLSLDLWDEGVVISILHPGFMRTEMTAGVGFDKYWDDGGGEYSYCIHEGSEEVSAGNGEIRGKNGTDVSWYSGDAGRGSKDIGRVGGEAGYEQERTILGAEGTECVAISDRSGLVQAGREEVLIICVGDIGTADVAMGTNLPTPLQLPW
jgi:hypothetical protein